MQNNMRYFQQFMCAFTAVSGFNHIFICLPGGVVPTPWTFSSKVFEKLRLGMCSHAAVHLLISNPYIFRTYKNQALSSYNGCKNWSSFNVNYWVSCCVHPFCWKSTVPLWPPSQVCISGLEIDTAVLLYDRQIYCKCSYIKIRRQLIQAP